MEAKKLKECLSINLKKYRKMKNWSQFELAENSGISEQTINSIEGLRLWPSDKTLSKISEALNIEVYKLFIPQNAKLQQEDIDELKRGFVKSVEVILHKTLDTLIY